MNGEIEARAQYTGPPIDFNEGEIQADGYLMKIYTESGEKPYEDVADEIKSAYGYYPELCEVNDDILFDIYRHPCDEKQLLGIMMDPDIGDEYIWIREEESFANHIKATLLEEPKNKAFALKKGDKVTVLAVMNKDEVRPIFWMKWMEEQGFSLKEMTERNNPIS